MRRWWISLSAIALVFLLMIVWFIGYFYGMMNQLSLEGRSTTVSRLSPDETILARLIEVSISPSVDRRFKLQLQFNQALTKDILLSPDQEQGGQPGTERLIWSKDGTKLLLVGRHFFVKDDLFLDNGDQLFFVYDIPTERGWSNADFPTKYPPLKAEMVEGIEFTEPIRLKK